MPDDNPILRHWHSQRKVLHDNCSVLRDGISVDAVHDFRVAIKKLRSYLKLQASLCNKKQPEDVTSIRNLFSVLGKHRNMDIAKNLLVSLSEKDNPYPHSIWVYLQLLQDQITPYCEQVIQQFSEEDLDKLTNDLKEDFENVNTADLSARVGEVIADSTKTVRHDLAHFRKQSHLIRKHLKDILYWSHIFEEEIFFTKPELKSLDKILDHLGSVQDHEVLGRNLKSFRKTILSNSLEEYEIVKKIETKVESKKDALLEKAHTMTEELISKSQRS